jgi:putative SOS response-associated peptidase YedK
MCNRYRVSARTAEIAARYGITLTPDPPTLRTTEIFPKREGWVVRLESGSRVLEMMRWGVPLNGKPITNVRNLQSPFWRSMLRDPKRRCLVPVTDFCEWEGEKGSKMERWFSLPASPIFSFAGVWRPSEEGNVFAFLTCEPNPLVAPIHEKAMPVILHEEDYDRWLSGEADDACALAAPFPSQLMKVA